MSKIRSIVYFFIYLGVLLFLRLSLIPRVFPNASSDSEIWFSSGLLLILLGICITEKYFTKSLDAVINSLTVIVVLMTVNSSGFVFYFPVFYFSIVIGFMGLISFMFFDESKSITSKSQIFARFLNKVSTYLGSSKILFSIIFMLSFVSYFISYLLISTYDDNQKMTAFLMIVFWGAALLLEPFNNSIVNPILKLFKSNKKIELIGRIIRRNSPNYITVQPSSSIRDFEFGDLIIIDDYLINFEQKEYTVGMVTEVFNSDDKLYLELYILVDKLTDLNNQINAFRPNIEINAKVLKQIGNNNIYLNKKNILGKVYKDSNIDIVKVKMLPNIDKEKNLEEGDLIGTNVYDEAVKYQILNVVTNEEVIDGNSKSGFKIITAQQIGFWQNSKNKFKDINWVPNPNSLMLTEEQSDSTKFNLESHCFKVGVVPKSNYPIYIDLNEAVNHHIAILGRTGSGKSVMASRLISKMVDNGYKVVLLEVDRENSQSLSKYIEKYNKDIISDEKTLWSRKTTNSKWTCEIDYAKVDGKKNVYMVDWDKEIKDKSTGPLIIADGAVAVIESIITYHEANPSEKLCIVMEEAYDFIPEFMFGNQPKGQPNVSRISQLVLKCRKHNIGFLIITQRTALVTKTILYSCNTIIALQSFDETSKNFMGAYIDSRYLESMSILPRYRAIVVGKGSSCDKPVIVDFEDKSLSNTTSQQEVNETTTSTDEQKKSKLKKVLTEHN